MIVRLPSSKESQPGSATSEPAPLRKTGREAAPDCSLPSRGKRVSDSPGLLAEDENTSLARKADFPYLSVLSEQQRIIDRLGAALFPSAFNSDLPSLAVCEMLMVLANGFANADTASARAASKTILRTNGFVFMRVSFLSNRMESATGDSCPWLEGVDTPAAGEYSRP